VLDSLAPSLLALIVKRDYGCPVVVTEHGVAFREVFLHYNAYLKKSSRIFWKTIATNVIKLLLLRGGCPRPRLPR